MGNTPRIPTPRPNPWYPPTTPPDTFTSRILLWIPTLRHSLPGTSFCNTPPEEPHHGTPPLEFPEIPTAGVPFLTSAPLRLLWVLTYNRPRTHITPQGYTSRTHTLLGTSLAAAGPQ